jgi:uncharacterized protein involved in cysteine biosynthesis
MRYRRILRVSRVVTGFIGVVIIGATFIPCIGLLHWPVALAIAVVILLSCVWSFVVSVV